MPSTGKLLANMHRSTPNASMACSSQGREGVGAHRPERHGQARQLAARRGRRASARASMPAFHSARSSSRVRPGPAGVLDHDHQVVEARPARRPRPASWSGWAISSNSRPRSCEGPQHVVGRERARRSAPIGRTPRKRERRHLPVEQRDRLGHRVRRREAADDGVGVAVGVGPAVELERLVDRVAAGGGGHVDQLLDVPPRRLGPVGGHVEAAGHPGDVAHVQLLAAGQVRVPVGAGRVPQVHVGVDDAGGSSVIGPPRPGRRRCCAACRRASRGRRARRR